MKDSYKCYEKVLIVIVTAIVLCFSVHVRASGVGNKESAQEIVNEYFSLIGNDWDKFAELYTNEQINSFKNFLENEKNIREYVGVLNVRKAKLIESIEIKYDDVKDMIDEDYTGKKIKIFAVGADYDVYEDTKYFSEGIIYNFLILEEQNGQWRVNTLMQIADPSLLKMKGYHFQSDYNITENIMEARENGYFNLDEIDYALMEVNGNISFLPKEKEKPVTKRDMKIKCSNEGLTVNAIIDSKYMVNNMKAINKDKEWLDHELKVNGYDNYDNILLATIDNNYKVTIYEKNVKPDKNTVLE